MSSNEEVRAQVMLPGDLLKFVNKDTELDSSEPISAVHGPVSTTPTAVAGTSQPSDDQVEKDMESAGVADVPGASSVMSIFSGDHRDVVLLGYYTALIKMFIGAGGTGDPTICPAQEEVITWLGFGVIIVVYVIRHFVQKPEKGKLLQSIAKCVLFAIFALCIHSQPISCSLPRPGPGQHAPGLTTLNYVQGAIILSVGLIATQAAHLARQAKKSQAAEDAQTKPTAANSRNGMEGHELQELRGNTARAQ